jgi:ABC-type sugar transport system substrate-binding protein
MKKLLVVLVVMMLVASMFVGCAAPAAEEAPAKKEEAKAEEPAAEAAEPEADPYEIVFVTPLVAHPVWDVAKNGFEDAAAELGFIGQYVGPQGIDPAEMVNQIEIALANEVDAIITMPIAPEAMRPVLKKCADAGVPVVFVGSVDPESTSLSFIGTNEEAMGAMGAQAIMDKMAGEPINAHILMSTMDASFAIKSRDGYLKAFESYEGEFNLVVNEACNSDMMVAMEKYQNSLAANPEINVLIGVCGEAGPAAAKVLNELGRDDVLVVAVDDVAETMDFVKSGDIYGTMAQNFYKMGNLGARQLVDFLNDGTTPEAMNDSGAAFVSMENIDTYTEALKQ